MAASLTTSIKKVIEAGGLGLRAYRDLLPPAMRDSDGAPLPEHLPFVTIAEGVSTLRQGRSSDGGTRVSVEVQVDLWQAAGQGERFELGNDLANALDEGRYEDIEGKDIHGVEVVDVHRFGPQPDATLVRTMLTLVVWRDR